MDSFLPTFLLLSAYLLCGKLCHACSQIITTFPFSDLLFIFIFVFLLIYFSLSFPIVPAALMTPLPSGASSSPLSPLSLPIIPEPRPLSRLSPRPPTPLSQTALFRAHPAPLSLSLSPSSSCRLTVGKPSKKGQQHFMCNNNLKHTFLQPNLSRPRPPQPASLGPHGALPAHVRQLQLAFVSLRPRSAHTGRRTSSPHRISPRTSTWGFSRSQFLYVFSQ